MLRDAILCQEKSSDFDKYNYVVYRIFIIQCVRSKMKIVVNILQITPLILESKLVVFVLVYGRNLFFKLQIKAEEIYAGGMEKSNDENTGGTQIDSGEDIFSTRNYFEYAVKFES